MKVIELDEYLNLEEIDENEEWIIKKPRKILTEEQKKRRKKRVRKVCSEEEEIIDDEIVEEKNKLEKWKEYINWCEKYEKNTLIGIFYSEFKVAKNKIIFQVDFDEEKYGEYNEFLTGNEIMIFDCEYSVYGEDREKFKFNEHKRVRGVIAGTFNGKIIKIEQSKNYLIEFSNEELNIDNIPEQGFLSKGIGGFLDLYKRQIEVLDKIIKGKEMTNRSLGRWILDSSYADDELDNIKVDSYLSENELNTSQKEAINGIVNSRELYLIQGPPGTGKTTVIAEGIYQLVKRGKRVLIASQTNLAVDNVLEKLEVDSAIRMIRFGRLEKISEGAKKFTKENIIREYYKSILDGVKKLVLEGNIEEIFNDKEKRLQEIEEYLLEIEELDEEKICIGIEKSIERIKN
ncbi:MAG: AAA domain-containing protein, partial [Clostridium sp.]